MKKHPLPSCAVCATILACTLALPAQEKGNWRALSTTAKSITGDVALSDLKVFINFSAFTIAQIRALTPAEANAVFTSDAQTQRAGNLYRLSIPASKQFLHHNTLCGSDETQWMTASVAGRNLQLTFFSGEKMPILTPEALSESANLCGAFFYVR